MAQKALFKGMLAVALTLGVLVVSCESDQLTTDDVKAAVHEEVGALNQRPSLDSEFLAGLKGSGYTVTQSGSNYTVTNEATTIARLKFASSWSEPDGTPTVEKNISIYVGESTPPEIYSVELRFKNGTGSEIEVSSGATTYTTAEVTTLGSAKELVLEYHIFAINDTTKSEFRKGEITLRANPTEAGIAKAIGASFESNLSSKEDFWTDVSATAFDQVTPAKYTFTVVRTSSGGAASFTLPTAYPPLYQITWGTVSGTPTSTVTSYTSTSNALNIASFANGTITVPFDISSSLVTGKKIAGTLVITAKVRS